MKGFDGRAYSEENPRQFENLLGALGGVEGRIPGTTTRIIEQAKKSQDPDGVLEGLEKFKNLLADRLTGLGGGDSKVPVDSPEYAEWRKELNEIYFFLDGVRHGLRVAKQRIEGKPDTR